MPLYEYQCDVCGRRFEKIQKFSDASIDVCPTCGGAATRMLSSPAIQFKGSGWYITDYARAGKSDSASAGSGKSESASTSSTSESKSESKSETKSESKAESKSESPSTSAKSE